MCGRELRQAPLGRRRRYCSRACRQRAFRLRERERVWRSWGSEVAADPAEVARLLGAALPALRS